MAYSCSSAQVADMHFAQGAHSACYDVASSHHCSDLNTTYFIERLLAVEKPDLVVFTGMIYRIPSPCVFVRYFCSGNETELLQFCLC